MAGSNQEHAHGNRIRVRTRPNLEGATISLSCAGLRNYEAMLELQHKLKGVAGGLRFTGSTALDLAYVACGRMEGYLEFKVRLWDIAAGVLMVSEGGGDVELRAWTSDAHTFEILSYNGKVDLKKLMKE